MAIALGDGAIFVPIFPLLESEKAGVVGTYPEREDVGGRGGPGWYMKVVAVEVIGIGPGRRHWVGIRRQKSAVEHDLRGRCVLRRFPILEQNQKP